MDDLVHYAETELGALTAARRTELALQARFDSDDPAVDPEELHRARVLRERAERRHASAAEAVARAKEAERRSAAEADRARFDEAVAQIHAAEAALALPLRLLIDLHAVAFAHVDRLVDVVISAEQPSREARELAAKLDINPTSVPRLDIDAVRDIAQAALGAAEREAERTSLNGWLEAAPEAANPAALMRALAILHGDHK